MSEILTAIIMLLGALLVLIGALGAVRMPDLLLRMHATTKAGALGTGLIAVAAAIFFVDTGVTVRALAIVAFVILTAPVAAHMIGRAGYFTGAPLWDKTLKDELHQRLDRRGHYLHSGLEDTEDAPRGDQDSQ